MATGQSDRDIQLTISISSSGEVTLKALKQELKSVESTIGDVNKELDATTKSVVATNKASQNIGDGFEKAKSKIKDTAKGITEAATAVTGITEGFKKSNESAASQGKTIEEVARKVDQLRDSHGRFTKQADDANAAVDQLKDGLQGAVVQGNILAAVAIKIGSAFLSLVGTVFKVGVNSFVESLRLMADIFTTVTKEVISSTESFEKFTITLEGSLKSASRAKEISAFVQAFALKTPQRVEELQDLVKSLSLIPALSPQFFGDIDKVKERLGTLFNTVIGLSSLNPQQGIPGAIFAIREALTGQFRSLRSRFDIMPEIVAGSINKTVSEIKRSPDLVIKALKAFTDEVVGAGVIEKAGNLPSVRIGNIIEGLTKIAPRQIGETGVQRLVQELLGSIDDTLQKFLEAGGDFESKFAVRIGDNLQRTLLGAVRIARAALRAAGIDIGSDQENPFAALAAGLETVLGRIASLVEGFASSLESQEGQSRLSQFFADLTDALSSFFDGLTNFVKALPTLLPLFGTFIKFAGGAIEGLFKFVQLAQSSLENIAREHPKLGALVFGDDFEAYLKKVDFRQQIEGQFGIRPSGQLGPNTRNLYEANSIPGGGGTTPEGRRVLTIFAAAESAHSAKEFVDRMTILKGDLNDPAVKSFIEGQKLKDLSTTLSDTADKISKVDSSIKDLVVQPGTEVSLLNRVFGITSGDQSSVDEQIATIFTSFEGAVKRGLQGSIATVKSQGLEVKEQLDKALLNPYEEASSKLIEVEDNFETGLKNLHEITKNSLATLPQETNRALSLLNPLDPEDVQRGLDAIQREAEARQNVLKLFTKTREEADRLRSVSASIPVIQLLQDFVKTDPRKLDETRAKIQNLFTLVGGLQPQLTGNATILLDKFLADFKDTVTKAGGLAVGPDSPFTQSLKDLKPDVSGLNQALQILNNIDEASAKAGANVLSAVDETRLRAAAEKVSGYVKVLGSDIIKQLAGFSIQIAAQEAQKLGEARSAFGKSPASQLGAVDVQLERLRSENEIQRSISDLIKQRNIPEKEQADFADQYRQILALQTIELVKQRETIKVQNQLQEEQRAFQKDLTLAGFSNRPDEARLDVIRQRMTDLQTLLRQDDGALGAFFGISANTNEALQRIKGLREAKVEEIRDLSDQELQLSLSIKKANEEFAKQKTLTETFSGQLAQQLNLIKQDRQGNLGLKSIENAFGDSARSAALQYVSSFQSTLGTSIYDAITGNFKDIKQAWTSLFDNLLRTFANFVAELLVKAAALQFVQSIFGIGGSLSGTLSGGTIASASNTVSTSTLGIFSAIGGVYGTGGITDKAQLALIGEGGRREAVIPLKHDGTIPMEMHDGVYYAVLPGGRRIPTSVMAYGSGGVSGGPSLTLGSPSGNISQSFGESARPIVIANVLSPNDVVAAGLPANADVIVNHVAGNVRNGGKVSQAMKRFR